MGVQWLIPGVYRGHKEQPEGTTDSIPCPPPTISTFVSLSACWLMLPVRWASTWADGVKKELLKMGQCRDPCWKGAPR